MQLNEVLENRLEKNKKKFSTKWRSNKGTTIFS